MGGPTTYLERFETSRIGRPRGADPFPADAIESGIVPAAIPAADVYETDKEYAFELEVPGFEERELTVEVSDRTLAVEGERTEAKDERKKEYRLRERLENAFERRFELPPEADPKSVGAEFAKGVLVVHAAKLEAAEPRKVEIADTR